MSAKLGLRGRIRIWLKAIVAALAVAALGLWLETHVGAGVRDVTTFVLALLAIGFAIYQFTDSAELKQVSTDIKETVRSVADASAEMNETVKSVAIASAGVKDTMSIVASTSTEIRETMKFVAEHQLTQYVGAFPSNMDEIEQLITRSSYKVKIMADVVGYGSYSRVHRFLNYVGKLQDLRQRLQPPIEVWFLVYDPPSREAAMMDQFRIERWEEIRSAPEFETFFRLHKDRLAKPTTYDEFIRTLGVNHDYYERLLADAGVQIRRRPSPFPFFMWLRDDCEAVFSFFNRRPISIGERIREITFTTRDGKLIDTFEAMFDELWESKRPHVVDEVPTSP